MGQKYLLLPFGLIKNTLFVCFPVLWQKRGKISAGLKLHFQTLYFLFIWRNSYLLHPSLFVLVNVYISCQENCDGFSLVKTKQASALIYKPSGMFVFKWFEWFPNSVLLVLFLFSSLLLLLLLLKPIKDNGVCRMYMRRILFTLRRFH